VIPQWSGEAILKLTCVIGAGDLTSRAGRIGHKASQPRAVFLPVAFGSWRRWSENRDPWREQVTLHKSGAGPAKRARTRAIFRGFSRKYVQIQSLGSERSFMRNESTHEYF